MLNRVIAWFDARYSPVALAKDTQPPMGVTKFTMYFVNQFRGAFLLRMVLVAIGSIADAMMPVFVGVVVGLLATTPPGQMFELHWQTFLLMVLVIAVVRPITFLLDTLVRNHSIVPNLVDIVRWQSHWHVIRQTWSYFQNDFAGRIANKIMQAGESIETSVNMTIDAVLVRPGIFVVVAVVVLARLDPVLLVPIGVWLLLYAHPVHHHHAADRSSYSEESLGGQVGDDRPRRRQLHQHPHAQDLLDRRARGCSMWRTP
jgi:ATP-binding cassette subfamily B multidrug efflux pump